MVVGSVKNSVRYQGWTASSDSAHGAAGYRSESGGSSSVAGTRSWASSSWSKA